MRILSVRNPWASAIIRPSVSPAGDVLVKDVENRSRNIAGSYRGPVAIHCARAWDEEAFTRPTGVLKDWWCWQLAPDDDRGHIIGVVDLVDVHRPLWDDSCDGDRVCSPWAETQGWPQHLLLANPRPLPAPIPFKGALGLRRLDDVTIARIEAQL